MAEIITGKSYDLIEDNIKKIKELFPEIVTDGKIDLTKLSNLLGDYVETDNEKYQMTWKGKTNCIKLAQTPSMGTLLPCKEESKNWDTTGNLYIEGDNLEVLKLLNKSYLNRIKMIYIDPPYNTGKDFVYADDFNDSIANYKKITDQQAKSNAETAGRYHTNWLNMLYPRLKLARNLLSDDGVIFISIDDNEQANLKKICDEIFGEDNFVAQINWKGRGGRQDSRHYAIIHEYILCYAKKFDEYNAGEEIKEGEFFPKFDKEKNRYYRTQLLRKWGANSKRSDRPNLFYPIIAPDGTLLYPMLPNNEEGCWRWSKSRMAYEIENRNIEFVKTNNEWIAYEKIYQPLEGEEYKKVYYMD